MRPFLGDWYPPLPSVDLTPEDYRILTAQQRCGVCLNRRTREGHDPCIADLPGVSFACCGHGGPHGYVAFKDGKVLRGEFDHMQDMLDAPAWEEVEW